MFVLTTIADLIQITPAELRKPHDQALEDNIHKKYANRVLQNVGLCICLWDVLRASQGLIGQGDGTVNVNIEFRMVVFRPFKGEILQGVILESSAEGGIRIGLDFFADVWIPAPANLPEGSLLVKSEATPCWVWNPDPDADPTNPDLSNAFWYEQNETVRFRVEDEIWHDASPEKPDFSSNANGDLTIRAHVAAAANVKGGAEGEKAEALKRPVPYAIIGSMGATGLGAVYWWRNGGEEGAEEDGDAEAGAEDMDED